MRTAAALIIGNELLTGKIAEANLGLLARTLHEIGVQLDRVVMIPDDCAIIAAEVRELSASRDVCFTSGGVGPTHDDVTMEAIAEAFGVDTVVPEQTQQLLDEYFGANVTEGHLRMARIPRGAHLLRSGRAPWPTVVMHNVWVLPGVPRIFAKKMALIRDELGGGKPFVSLAVCTRLDECSLKPYLDQVVAAFPQVQVGSYPRWERDSYHTQVTFDGQDEPGVRSAKNEFAQLLPADTIIDAG